MRPFLLLACVLISGLLPRDRTIAADPDAVRQSLRRATEFMTNHVAVHGGYAWVSSADGKYSHGEGVAGPTRVWVQPPGTPAVGMALLEAYQATGDEVHLNAARAAAEALIQGQLRSGGWGYSIEFDSKARQKIPYRVGPNGGRDKIAKTPRPGGWDIWRQRKFKTNKTMIDDDVTPASIRFLAKLDQELNFKDASVHDAAQYALRSVLGAQYPIGAWGHNYDRYAMETPSAEHYPILKASYPDDWSRRTTNDFHGCYMINDRITLNMIRTMLLAAKIYDDDRYRKSAITGGQFLLNAQMPEPQPAWAQQYDRHMKPVWDRKFEPPAITGGESQDVLEVLVLLYEETKDRQYLQAFQKAYLYLSKSLRPDGKLARYYELKTNRPIYFSKDYELTYDDSEMPDHYGFVIDSRLDKLLRLYNQATGKAKKSPTRRRDLAKRVDAIVAAQRQDGAWLEPGFVRNEAGKKVIPPEGIVQSDTFIKNVSRLCDYLNADE